MVVADREYINTKGIVAVDGEHIYTEGSLAPLSKPHSTRANHRRTQSGPICPKGVHRLWEHMTKIHQSDNEQFAGIRSSHSFRAQHT